MLEVLEVLGGPRAKGGGLGGLGGIEVKGVMCLPVVAVFPAGSQSDAWKGTTLSFAAAL